MPDFPNPVSGEDVWTILKILTWTQSYFKSHSIDSPRLTAEILLAHSLGLERLDLYLQFDRPLEKQELSRFKALIKKRVQKEPVAYITGSRGFFDADFKVTPDVLIPRPDTELIVEQSLLFLEQLQQDAIKARVLELGTGSGAIIVSLAKALPEHCFFADDISIPAIRVAAENAKQIAGGKISFFAGQWLSAVREGAVFNLIVSNPPYIPTLDINTLQPEIREFEPRLALDGGVDGLGCYRTIIDQAHRYLVQNGALMLEIGFDQKPGIQAIATQIPGYQPPVFVKDLSGHDRVAILKKSID